MYTDTGFHEEYSLDEEHLGLMMMVANIFAGLSALAATPLVNLIGAINTMVSSRLINSALQSTQRRLLCSSLLCLICCYSPSLGLHTSSKQHPSAAGPLHAHGN